MGYYQSKQSQARFDKLKTQAYHLQEQGRYTKALKVYSQIIQLSHETEDTQLAYSLSKAYQVNKQAIRYVTESLEVERTADKYCILADLHNQMEEPSKAIQNYQKALQIKQKCVEEETKRFLDKSITIKRLPQLKELVEQNLRIEQVAGIQPPKDVEYLIKKSNSDIGVMLKYNYGEAEEKAKELCITQLKNMMMTMMERVGVLEEENKRIKQQQKHYYKNHELLFNQMLESSTLSAQNQNILRTYFTMFCSKMQLFYQSLKLLNKIPDSALSLDEIYIHVSQGEEAFIQIQKKLKNVVDHLQLAQGVLEQIPYVSIIFGIFRQFDKYFNKYVEHVHDDHKLTNILKTWMNSQVFNDFAADVAFRITNKMRLRVLNHSEPSFKNYLKVLWGKLVKIYKYKNQAAKLKQLQHQHYNRKEYIAKLAQRDAAIVFYSFQMQKLKRKGNIQQMADDIVHLISQFDGMKIEQTFTPAKPSEQEPQKGRMCLLF